MSWHNTKSTRNAYEISLKT